MPVARLPANSPPAIPTRVVKDAAEVAAPVDERPQPEQQAAGDGAGVRREFPGQQHPPRGQSGQQQQGDAGAARREQQVQQTVIVPRHDQPLQGGDRAQAHARERHAQREGEQQEQGVDRHR